MKLPSLASGRDGELVVVSRDLARAVRAAPIASTLQCALHDWPGMAPRLSEIYERLDALDAFTRAAPGA